MNRKLRGFQNIYFLQNKITSMQINKTSKAFYVKCFILVYSSTDLNKREYFILRTLLNNKFVFKCCVKELILTLMLQVQLCLNGLV